MSLLDLVQQHLGPDQLRALSSQLGADPARTQSAVDAALPMLLGGMAQTAQQPGGAATVAGAMQERQGLLDGLDLGSLGALAGSLGGLGGLLGGVGGGGGSGGGLLGQILGRHESTVEDGVRQASGLNSGQTRQLLMVLAPIVLAALARRRQQAAPAGSDGADLDGDGIPDVLQREAQVAHAQASQRSPQIGGIIGKILNAVT